MVFRIQDLIIGGFQNSGYSINTTWSSEFVFPVELNGMFPVEVNSKSYLLHQHDYVSLESSKSNAFLFIEDCSRPM